MSRLGSVAPGIVWHTTVFYANDTRLQMLHEIRSAWKVRNGFNHDNMAVVVGCSHHTWLPKNPAPIAGVA